MYKRQANSGDGTVSVFYDYGTSVAGTYPAGSNPQGVACESYYVWVTNTDSDTVTQRGAWAADQVYTTLSVDAAPQAIVFDNSNMWVAHTATNTLSVIDTDSRSLTTVTLPAGAQPTKMCFNGTHLLVQCANRSAYRIDIYTLTILAIPTPWRLGNGTISGVLAFDGVATWAVSDGSLYRTVV